MSELRASLAIVVLLTAMLIAGGVGIRHRVGAVLLALLSVLWLLVDESFEGVTLVTFTQSHGLVVADLVGLAGLAVSAGLWVRRR